MSCSSKRPSSGLPAWWGRFPLGVPFARSKGTKTRLGRSPLRTPLGVLECTCVKAIVGPSPLLWRLVVPPHQVTLGSWPYSWAVSPSGPSLVCAAFPPPRASDAPLWCCGKGRGLPNPLAPRHCPERFGRGKPLPYFSLMFILYHLYKTAQSVSII